GNDFADTRLAADDGGKPTSHGFEWRDGIAVFERRSNVGVRRSKVEFDIRARRQMQNTGVTAGEWGRGFVALCKNPDAIVAEFSGRASDTRQPFLLPIVSD